MRGDREEAGARPGGEGARPGVGPAAGRSGGPGSGSAEQSALAAAPGGSRTCGPGWSSPGVERRLGWEGRLLATQGCVFCGAAAGTPTARRTPSAAAAEAGARGVFPGASEGEVAGFLPSFSYWAPLLHCPVPAFPRPAKYQQAVDSDAFSGFLRGKRFLCQPVVSDYFSFKLL